MGKMKLLKVLALAGASSARSIFDQSVFDKFGVANSDLKTDIVSFNADLGSGDTEDYFNLYEPDVTTTVEPYETTEGSYVTSTTESYATTTTAYEDAYEDEAFEITDEDEGYEDSDYYSSRMVYATYPYFTTSWGSSTTSPETTTLSEILEEEYSKPSSVFKNVFKYRIK